MEEVYGSAFAEEEAFEEALDQSLEPRGQNMMFELVAGLGLLPGSLALDVGAREGYHCIELARRFGFTVHGVEPARRHLGEPDGSVDLVWCRDTLEHVADLDSAFGEFRRVLRPGDRR